MTDNPVLTASEIEPAELNRFLKKVYKPRKSEFIIKHGAWWHRGNENRWLMREEGEIAAYCAIIPTTCSINGASHESLWWVDLIVDPAHRGKGLQHILDEKVRQAADLKLGFPNELAAKIHLKHGWGVRDDLRYLMLPLIPLQLKRIRTSTGLKGIVFKAIALLLSPAAALFRWWLARYRSFTVRRVDNPDPDMLATIFVRHMLKQQPLVTTHRDADYLCWRYLDSAYRSELTFYVAGQPESPTHALITRLLDTPSGDKAVRIVELFGDMTDQHALRDVIRLAIADAVGHGAVDITAIATLPSVITALKSCGFFLNTQMLFCWHSTSAATMDALKTSPIHWVFSDSDNDEPLT